MKTKKLNLPLSLAVLVLAFSLCQGVARPPVIASFSQNGQLICTNLSPGAIAAIAWAPSPDGPWSTNLDGLNSITVPTNGAIQVTVPMNASAMAFYRVLQLPTPNPYAGMALVPAGAFTMGDSTGDGIPDANPMAIYVSAFYMDTNLVSLGQWQPIYSYATNIGYVFDDSGSAKNSENNQPIQTVNWYDAVKWCNARSQMAGLTPIYYTDAALTQVFTNGETDTVYPNWTANGFRLPTEAEWEKAARGGLNAQRFPWGMTISETQANYEGDTEDYAYDLGPDGYNTNFDVGAQPYTSPVGSFQPNEYGLYDMAANLQEWCWDWYGTPYGQPTTNNPTGAPPGTFRVVRGGCWGFYSFIARCASRGQGNPSTPNDTIGFRCVKNP